jgi:demethylmenaquinone methyltransferase/2-methoxy-6-polyprenyl-1,4-benzoquinol methylase
MPAPNSAIDEARAAAAGGAAKRAYVQRIFSEIAPRYDLLNHLLSFNIDKRWRARAIAALEWRARPDGVYVDLCAGTLDVSAQLSRQRGFTGTIVGADFAEPMLRAGSAKVAGTHAAPVVADALTLPLRDGSAAGAVVAFGIRNLADLDEGLREVARVLRPGGRFVILEFSTPRVPIVRTAYRLYFHRVLPAIGSLVSGHPTAYRYLPESVDSFPEAELLAQRMRRAGFSEVTWSALSFGIAALHVGTRGS